MDPDTQERVEDLTRSEEENPPLEEDLVRFLAVIGVQIENLTQEVRALRQVYQARHAQPRTETVYVCESCGTTCSTENEARLHAVQTHHAPSDCWDDIMTMNPAASRGSDES